MIEPSAVDERDVELRETRRIEDIRAVMSTAAGRRWVWRLLESTGVWGASFTGDSLTSAHAEGRRFVGVALMAELQRDAEDSYVRMVAEQLQELVQRRGEERAREAKAGAEKKEE